MKPITTNLQNLINAIKENFKEHEGYDIYIRSIDFDTRYQMLNVHALKVVKDEIRDYREIEVDFTIDPVDLENAEKDIVG